MCRDFLPLHCFSENPVQEFPITCTVLAIQVLLKNPFRFLENFLHKSCRPRKILQLWFFTQNSVLRLTNLFSLSKSPGREHKSDSSRNSQSRILIKTKAFGTLSLKTVRVAYKEKPFSTTFMF